MNKLYLPKDVHFGHALDGDIAVQPDTGLTIVGRDLNGLLNFRELRALGMLVAHSDEYINREEMGHAIWPEGSIPAQGVADVLQDLRARIASESVDISEALSNKYKVGWKINSSWSGIPKPEVMADAIEIADRRVKIVPLSWLIIRDEILVEDIPKIPFIMAHSLAKQVDCPTSGEDLLYEATGKRSTKTSHVRVHMNTLRAGLGPELGHPTKGAFQSVYGTGRYVAVTDL